MIELPRWLTRDGEPERVVVCGSGEQVSALEGDLAGRPWEEAERMARVQVCRVGLMLGLAANLELERRAVAAFRHLRASPLAELLLPALRGVAWSNAVMEHAWLSGGLEELRLPPRERLLRDLISACEPLHNGLMAPWGGALARVRAEAGRAVEGAVDRWLEQRRPDVERAWIEVDRLSRDLGGMAGGRMLAAGDEAWLALRAWCADTVRRARVNHGWWRFALVRAVSGSGLSMVAEGGRVRADGYGALLAGWLRPLPGAGEDPSGDMDPGLRRELEGLARLWAELGGEPHTWMTEVLP